MAAAQEHAAGALWSLAIKDDVATAGAIPPLVALLGAPGSAAVQSEAVGALHCLAGHANNEVRIAAAGAIPLLVALLGAHNTAVVQVKAAWVLRSLVCSTDNKVKIAASLPWWPCWALRSLQRCRRRQQRLCKSFVFAMMTTAENANFESPDCQD